MSLFIVGLILFLGIHSVSIVAPQWRDAQVAKLGEWPWKGVYSVVSVIGLVVLIYGYGMARQSSITLYAPPAAMRHVALLLMIPVFPLLLSAYLPGRIKAAAKHPFLVAVKLWAFAHLLANGSLADVLLFGSFLAWAVFDRISVKRRVVQHNVPAAPPSKMNDVIAVVAGLAVYALFVVWAHQKLIGVSPLA